MSNERVLTAQEKLARFQRAFGKAISTPFGWRDGEAYCRTADYSIEFLQQIIPLNAQSEIDRLKTYNQQYWYRLLDIMQGELPLLCAHLGYYDFNRWATQYLELFPSTSPDLNDLIQYLPHFLEIDQILTPIQKQWVEIDYRMAKLFIKAEQEIEIKNQLSQMSVEEGLNSIFTFQEGCFLTISNTDHHRRRTQFKQGDFSEADSFGVGDFPLIVYRLNGGVYIEDLSLLEYQLLRELYKGQTLTESVASVYEKSDLQQREWLVGEIQEWFQRWTSLSFFTGAHLKR